MRPDIALEDVVDSSISPYGDDIDHPLHGLQVLLALLLPF